VASGGDRLTFAGDAVFAVGFEHPDWYNGFEHDPEEAARVRANEKTNNYQLQTPHKQQTTNYTYLTFHQQTLDGPPC
jgi:hypothetical protein